MYLISKLLVVMDTRVSIETLTMKTKGIGKELKKELIIQRAFRYVYMYLLKEHDIQYMLN